MRTLKAHKNTKRETWTPSKDVGSGNSMKPKEKRTPSSYQLAIYRDVESGKGHTVVIARAGTGKTTTAIDALDYTPRGATVLMVAFNKIIATELSQRAPSHVEVSTLHSYGLKAVTKAFGRCRIDSRRSMTFAESLMGDDPETFLRRVALCKTLSLAKGCLAHDAQAIDAVIDEFGIDDVPTVEEKRIEFVKYVIKMLEMSKDVKDSIDFDDMIWLPVVCELTVWQYDRVFVDETQDLNKCQIELCLRAVKKNGRICAIGDDRQAIYGFRGADKNAINNVIERLGAKTLPLTVSYRCAKSIVALAKQTVEDFEAWEGSPDGLIQEMNEELMKQSVKPGDFILSRANAPLISLCFEFLRQGRRAMIQGRDLGKSLTSMIKNSKANSVTDFLTWLEKWYTTEVERIQRKRGSTQMTDDKYNCFLVLCEGTQSLNEVTAKINSLFDDIEGSDGNDKIILSSTHKAKGLERDRVFVLQSTYRRRPEAEEDNLWYVAVTRAKRELFLVQTEVKKRKAVG